jgi:hypothetical protein
VAIPDHGELVRRDSKDALWLKNGTPSADKPRREVAKVAFEQTDASGSPIDPDIDPVGYDERRKPPPS